MPRPRAIVFVNLIFLLTTDAYLVPQVTARHGQVAIGRVSGGNFGLGTFSVNEPGRNYGNGDYGRIQPQDESSQPERVVPLSKDDDITARHGQVAIGRVSGGNFGLGTFSVNEPGRNYGNGDYGRIQPQDESSQPERVVPLSKDDDKGTVSDKGKVVIGKMSGGKFGPGSFSTGDPGQTVSENGDQSKPGLMGNQKYISGYNTGDGTSIAIDSISGGSYPANHFSIGHGKDSIYSNGGNGEDVRNSNINGHSVEYHPPKAEDTKKKSWFQRFIAWWKGE